MTGEPESVVRLQGLLDRLEEALRELEGAADAETAVERLGAMAELAKEVQAEIDEARRQGAP